MTPVLVDQSETVQVIGVDAAGLVVAHIFQVFDKFAYVRFGVFLGLAVAAGASSGARRRLA